MKGICWWKQLLWDKHTGWRRRVRMRTNDGQTSGIQPQTSEKLPQVSELSLHKGLQISRREVFNEKFVLIDALSQSDHSDVLLFYDHDRDSVHTETANTQMHFFLSIICNVINLRDDKNSLSYLLIKEIKNDYIVMLNQNTLKMSTTTYSSIWSSLSFHISWSLFKLWSVTKQCGGAGLYC